ncbi:PREDICTED: uncharacterized protein LOC104600038 [Nelumbo nucifera]|uniref:Uncharacterized protein LOC104600038 n=2 Tax=Nelumbo nucifera TaxID=4432 RepID=A0A1U8A442_NELNU|nr:PREDICTED: uncharacterized protein LOC104600038 [Nelumbo nucifera]DAD40210.1 TPA_asm: hypothetical protein HUJ06_014533 [Nelumbo nucifera]
MSMLDAFFNKGFKGAKCKTLLKLTIPRIKLLRNRREAQIKQMRKEISKLLETGQEATARIRVEHIIRDEKMIAAQEIIELYCELIAVRLPIIEAQRECPLDLKGAISSVCFAAPRCADLPELQQVQMLFANKYGKEFVSAATELMPDCGVDRKLIELLSVRAPLAEAKLKLLKEIAEEHELDWDPAASETEFFKPHEDLLNGPTQLLSGSKLPMPKEKHDNPLYSAPAQAPDQQSDSDTSFATLDLPEVPKLPLEPSIDTVAPNMGLPVNAHEFRKNSEGDLDIKEYSVGDHGPITCSSNENHGPHVEPEEVAVEPSVAPPVNVSAGTGEDKQFLSFIAPPSLSSASFLSRKSKPAPSILGTKSEANVDLQDVLAAAEAAAESAEHAAVAARSAASLAQIRITEFIKKINEAYEGNDFTSEDEINITSHYQSDRMEISKLDHQQSFGDTDGISYSLDLLRENGSNQSSEIQNSPTYDAPREELDVPTSGDRVIEHKSIQHQPQPLPSMDDDPYFSYPNLFTPREPDLGSNNLSMTSNSIITPEF